jgi:hypothetical protein
MTEQEWSASVDPRPLIFAAGISERKRRLFASACCRRVLNLLPDKRNRVAIEGLELFADCMISPEQLARAAESAWDARRVESSEAGRTAGLAIRYAASPELTEVFAETAARDAAYAVGEANGIDSLNSEAAAQANLLRDIFGNPFRPVAFAPSWRTSAALDLARAMYESRDFAAMPILADALEDAGCENGDVLAHCRGDGPHVRGCWVVDLVLGKE